jgi:VanZ family protein
MLRLLIVVLAIILYGSLFPLRFEAAGALGDAARALANGWPADIARGDALANILLYIPLGFALAGLALRRAVTLFGAIVAALAATLLGAALSACIEIAQFFIPVRTVSLSDFTFNAFGSSIGAVFAVLSRFAGAGRTPRIADIFALMLALAWAADRLWPLVPALDVSNIKNALKPFLFAFSLSPVSILRLGLGWFLFAVLAQAALGRSKLVETLILLAVLAVAFSPPFLLGRTLTADGLAGAMLGLVLWALWRNLGASAARLLPLAAAIALVAVVGLAPYRFLDTPRGFNFIPFTDFIGSTRQAAAQSMILKSFLFGALVWAMAQARAPLALVAVLGPGLLLAISVAQMWLPGRSAALTDAVIGLAMVFALAALRRPQAPVDRPRPRDPRRETPVLPSEASK